MMKKHHIIILNIITCLFSQPYGWIDDPGCCEYNSWVIAAIVQKNGSNIAEDGDAIAVFNTNGEIRGIATQLIAPFGPYQGNIVYEMTIRSDNPGEVLTLKYYDASNHIIYNIGEDYTFQTQEQLGDITDPIFYNLAGNGIIEVLYNSDVDIGGFQFNVTGVTVNSASGGVAEDSGFSITTGNNTVIGFSLSGNKIPAGEGVLVNLDVSDDATNPCLSGLVMSDDSGNALDAEVNECVLIDINVSDCQSGTVFKENFLGYDDICVPTSFSTVNQSTLQSFYAFYVVTVNQAEIANDDWVGAYNGNTCVGARQWDISKCSGGVCDVPIMGDDGNSFTDGYMTAGLIPTFKIYDSSENKYYSATPSEEVAWFNMTLPAIDELASTTTISGCTNPNACNYDASASQDNGSCILPDSNNCCENGFSPDGGVSDCNGICGGGATIDECGNCGGDCEKIIDTNFVICGDSNSNAILADCEGNCGGMFLGTGLDGIGNDECGICAGDGPEENYNCDGDCTSTIDCNGICGGSSIEDLCGVCGGNNETCLDCANVANGDNYIDNCSVCDNDPSNDCKLDCLGEWGGSANVDECGICDSDISNDCVQDCEGAWGGSVNVDECGVCGGNGIDQGKCDCSGNILDCSGNCGGLLALDGCGVCGGDNSSGENCTECGDGSDPDCNGNCGGDASLDNCNICDNDSTNDCTQDCAEVWGGTALYDCAAVCNGNAYIDNCNTCDDDPLNDCTQDCLGVWGGITDYDDCNVCGGDNSSCSDCNGDLNGSAILDRCGICSSGNSGHNACIGNGECAEEDCTGFCFGDDEIDECGVCAGGGPLGPDGNPNSSYDCQGNCISDLDCSGVCGGLNIATFNCFGELLCNPSECILDVNPLTLPDEFGINRIFPNPFNPIVQIDYDISEYSLVTIRVINIQGREIASLQNGFQNPGFYQLRWNASKYASGMYFVQMLIRSNSQDVYRDIHKILYLK